MLMIRTADFDQSVTLTSGADDDEDNWNDGTLLHPFLEICPYHSIVQSQRVTNYS